MSDVDILIMISDTVPLHGLLVDLFVRKYFNLGDFAKAWIIALLFYDLSRTIVGQEVSLKILISQSCDS